MHTDSRPARTPPVGVLHCGQDLPHHHVQVGVAGGVVEVRRDAVKPALLAALQPAQRGWGRQGGPREEGGGGPARTKGCNVKTFSIAMEQCAVWMIKASSALPDRSGQTTTGDRVMLSPSQPRCPPPAGMYSCRRCCWRCQMSTQMGGRGRRPAAASSTSAASTPQSTPVKDRWGYRQFWPSCRTTTG
jgi:hypothetical protein